MTLLIIGLLIWSIAHFAPLAAPGPRAKLNDALGAGPARGVMAVAILVGLVLMVIGYRASPYEELYLLPGWATHLNNLMMMFSVLLFGAARSPNFVSHRLRHPMLRGTLAWAAAHLLVNGDVASVVLFGGLAAWAVACIILSNRRDGAWERPGPGDRKSNIKLVVISGAVYIAIVLVHSFALGYPTFPQ